MLDQEKCIIRIGDEDFIRDITYLMTAEEDVQFKVKSLNIGGYESEQIHILEWLLLKSPNLINLSFYCYRRRH
jgi:hypothetical protein